MDLIQKAKALCLSACLEAVIAIICICAYAIAVDVPFPRDDIAKIQILLHYWNGLCYGVGMGFFSSI